MPVSNKEAKMVARSKKDGTYFIVCIKTEVYNKLVQYCEETGKTKTVAVKRIWLIQRYEISIS